MLTKSKKRIYISISPEVEKALGVVSDERDIPVASAASDLLEKALEIEEDVVWDSIATNRKNSNEKFYSHEEAWA